MVRTTWIAIGLFAFVLELSVAGAAHAADPRGLWLTQDREARVRIADCQGGLCGTIASLREPRDPHTGRLKTDEHNHNSRLRGRPLVGVQIIIQMQRSQHPDEWVGHVYNPDDGGVYSAKLTMRGEQTLRLEGCMLGNALCSGQTWTRTR